MGINYYKKAMQSETFQKNLLSVSVDSDLEISSELKRGFYAARDAQLKYLRINDIDALRQAGNVWVEIVESESFLQSNTRFKILVLLCVGFHYLNCFEISGNLTDIDMTLSYWRKALQALPPKHQIRALIKMNFESPGR